MSATNPWSKGQYTLRAIEEGDGDGSKRSWISQKGRRPSSLLGVGSMAIFWFLCLGSRCDQGCHHLLHVDPARRIARSCWSLAHSTPLQPCFSSPGNDKFLFARSVQKFARKVDRANPGIRANDDSGQKCRKSEKCRACLVQTGFEALYEIDPKVKGTPFEPFRNPINSGFYFCQKCNS